MKKSLPRHSSLAVAVATLACAAAAVSSAHAAVGLASPPDNATVERAPVFTWNAVRNASYYELQLAADDRFASSVLGGSSSNSLKTANTAVTLSKNLADGSYYWRVRSVSASGRASKWSGTRSFVKSWSTAPTLIDPNEMFEVIWPIAPLRLHWSSVPGAVAYSVVIATDPSLAAPIVGGTKSPLDTQGTTLALPNALAPGTYYWAITPKDSDGHPGRQSAIGSFTWSWPSQTTPTLNDLNPAPNVMDPQFSWTPVAGAARYEVEVNPSPDWNPAARVCCNDPTIGTSLSPKALLANNNVYYWRIRAIDAQGDVGQWNQGQSFQREFDPTLTPRIVDDSGAQVAYPTATDNPIVKWDPVPGASSYEVQLIPWDGVKCDEQDPNVIDDIVYGLAWTPLAHSPGNIGIGWPSVHGGRLDTGTYCVRVAAQSQNKIGFTSVAAWVGTPNGPGLSFAAQPSTPPRAPFVALPSDYLAPAPSSTVTRLPLFAWQRIPGADGYYVAVARDANFTNVIDVAYTTAPAYAVRSSTQSGGNYTDESNYYWAVIPYSSAYSTTFLATDHHPQTFDKQSIPPGLAGPADGADVNTQPIFSWTGAEGARSYRLQVAADPNFGSLLDDVATDSTSYTSSTTYPVDTVLYWRVRAVDGRGVGLNWSTTSTFRRRLPAPTPLDSNPSGGADIPALGWSNVTGALSYGVHVDYPSGTTKDFTVYSTVFTPTEFYGNGVWHWKVRANFPNGTGTSSVGGAYTASQAYTRIIPAPTGGLATRSAHRVLVTWNADPHAYRYRLQTSRSSSFDNTIENVTTEGPAYAPTLTGGDYKTGGKIYWRIASLDKGGNQGAFANGTFVLPRSFLIRTSGTARKGRRSGISVTLLNASRKPIRGATVTVSGAGVRKVHKRVDRHGVARFVVRPTRRGAITIRVHKTGYTDALATVKVR